MASQAAANLESLGDNYQILGELRGRRKSRCYIAKRRSDGADALVVVMGTPEGDERNALSHLAADTKLLIDHKHRNLIRILDGQWIDDDAFAVVSARVAAPTLGELLDRGEVLSSPRIAVILREVWSVLTWAREQRVVHRAVTPDTLFVDPKTDRVLVSFTIRPIKVMGRGDTVEEDARTIGRLAWTMLARSAESPDDVMQTLHDLRPDLPLRVVDATQTLVSHEGDGSALPNVLDYIATVAMAESLMLGEVETAHLQAIIVEEQQEERKAWQAQQQACETELRERTVRLAKEREELLAQVASERADMEERRREQEESTAKRIADIERAFAKRTEELEQTHAKQREESERAFAERHEELERTHAKQVQALAKQRDETERAFAKRQSDLERAHAKQVQELERTHAKQTHDLERAHTRRTEDLENQFAKRNTELEQTFARRKQELEQLVARQQQELEREVAKHREQAAADRQALERETAKRREELAVERKELAREMEKQREEIVADRQATKRDLAKRREDFDRGMGKERSEFERWVTRERQEMASARTSTERTLTDEWARLEKELAKLAQERADIDAYWARTEERIQDLEARHACLDEGDLELEAEEERHRRPVASTAREEAPADREVSREVNRDQMPDEQAAAARKSVEPAGRTDAKHDDDDEGEPLPPALLALASSQRRPRASARPTRAESDDELDDELEDADEEEALPPPVRSPEEVSALSWRERARRALGSRWTIPGAGMVLIAATATALAIGGGDGDDGDRSVAAVVDSAAGSVALPARPTPDSVRSIVPLPESALARGDTPLRDGNGGRRSADADAAALRARAAERAAQAEARRREEARATASREAESREYARQSIREQLRPRVDTVVATSRDTFQTPAPSVDNGNFISRIMNNFSRPEAVRRDTAVPSAPVRPDTVARPDSMSRRR